MNQLRDARGVSLVELMMATLVFSVVAAFGMRFLVLQHGWAVYQEDVAEAQQQARAALDLMGRELSLLGFGVPEGDEKISKATVQEIEFLANLNAAIAYLSQEAGTAQKQLSVGYVNNKEYVDKDSQDKFEKGKTVSICTLDYCEWHTLAKNGGEETLELNEGLSQAFSTGSTVHLVKRILYALKAVDSNRFNLNRTVDNGKPAPVAEGLASMSLEYLNGTGQPETVLTDIQRIRIQLTARMPRSPEKVRTLVSEVYLRNR